MSGHAFVWRSGRVSWLYISQPLWAMVPLAGGGFLLSIPLSMLGLWRGLAVAVVSLVWAMATTGTAVLVRPTHARAVFFFWGLPLRWWRLSPHFAIDEDGGFDSDAVVLSSGDVVVEIETGLGGAASMADELHRAQRRAAMVPLHGGPRIHHPV